MAGLLYLPNQDWTVATKADINAAAAATGSAADRQITVAADGQRLRIIYGRDRLGADLANVVVSGPYVYAVCVWGVGPIAAVESITMGDKPLTGYTADHYLGSPGQTVHAGLQAAFAANGITYTDALPGVAYSVVWGPVGQDDFDPMSISAVVRGRTVFDPRTNTTAWTDNPALCLADFIASDDGMGRSVDWPGVVAAANACDELVGGVKRRRIGLTLDEPLPCETWVETLRTYAGCFVVQREAGWRLVPDRPAASVASFDHAAGQLAAVGPLRKRRRADSPTVMTVRWTDTSAIPWRDRAETVYLPGVQAGTVPRRASEVALPGIQSASQARREAIERINKLTLSDLSFTVDVFDEAGVIEEGDVVTVSYAPRGLAGKDMRVASAPDSTAAGRYTLTLSEYDPAVYSDTVVTDPTTPDTSLPSPAAPLPVTDLQAVEELMQRLDGTWTSRIRASWVPPAQPFTAGYRIDLRVAGQVVATGTAGRSAVSWPSPPVLERKLHQVDVVVLSSIGAESVAASVTLTPQGKYLPPGNVPSVTGYEVGGETRLQWGAAVDIDIERYEVRWGAVGVAWADAKLLDRVDALRLASKDIPVGSWDFLVCASDSVKQYSPVPARCTVAVTRDAAAFLVDEYVFTSPTVTGMREYALHPADPVRRWITEQGVPFGALFPDPMNTYTDPLGSYKGGPSEWVTEVYDFGAVLAGNWAATLDVTTLAGTTTVQLELSLDAVTWVQHPLSVKAQGRFVRLRASNAMGAMAISLPGAGVRIDAVPMTERGTAVSSVLGPTEITLERSYVKAYGLPQITVGGTTPGSAVVDDNIDVGTPTKFRVYIFDEDWNLVSRPFGWVFNGV